MYQNVRLAVLLVVVEQRQRAPHCSRYDGTCSREKSAPRNHRLAHHHQDHADHEHHSEARAWASRLTADEHVSCIKSLVATLWSDHYEAADSWAEALRSWVEAECEQERKEREQRAQEDRERCQRLDNLKGTVTVSGQSITPSKGDIEQAVEAIDVADVVRKYASRGSYIKIQFIN